MSVTCHLLMQPQTLQGMLLAAIAGAAKVAVQLQQQVT
jgi:hypothetical protein